LRRRPSSAADASTCGSSTDRSTPRRTNSNGCAAETRAASDAGAAEFALGIEALEQFVVRALLRNVYRAVFGILAQKAEPSDPRL